MGQAITKCIHPAAAEDNPQGIDPSHLKPRGLYPNQSAYFKQAKVKKLILQGNVAPCFPASDEDPEMELEDCKVCLLYYPALNHCKCSAGLCTECYLELTKHKGDPPCPGCQYALATTYTGPRSDLDKEIAKQARIASEEAATRARKVEKEQFEQAQRHSRDAQPSTSAPAPVPDEAVATIMEHLSREGVFGPLPPPQPLPPAHDGDIPSSSGPSVNVHASSGTSPPRQSGQPNYGSFETKGGDAAMGHGSPLPPPAAPIINMVVCRYNRPLPPLFAMLATFSGSDVPVSEQSDTAVHASGSVQIPHEHASSTVESSGAESMSMSQDIGEAPSTPDPSTEGRSQDADMAVEQNRMDTSQQQSSSEEMEHKAESADDIPNATPLHFGFNEPVLMLNPDGSKLFVLLKDELAAKELEIQKRKEETAAAIAAAKAATYWAPSDDHDAAVMAAIEQEDAAVRERIARQEPVTDATGTSTFSHPAEASSSRQRTPAADDSFQARCRAADEALTAIINRRDAEAAAHAAAGRP